MGGKESKVERIIQLRQKERERQENSETESEMHEHIEWVGGSQRNGGDKKKRQRDGRIIYK